MSTTSLEIEQAIALTAEMVGRKLSPEAIAAMTMELSERPRQEVLNALRQCCRECKDGRFSLANVLERMPGCQKRSPSIVWAEVLTAMEDHGAYESVCFTDSTINKVIRVMGGWPAMCRADIGEPWTQKEFERLYTDYQGYPLVEDGYLPGLCEADNGSKGLREWIKPPIMIGAGDGPKALPEGSAGPDILSMLLEAADATKL